MAGSAKGVPPSMGPRSTGPRVARVGSAGPRVAQAVSTWPHAAQAGSTGSRMAQSGVRVGLSKPHVAGTGSSEPRELAVELREVWVKVRGEVPGREGYSDQTQ
jgi:hypothetical protein